MLNYFALLKFCDLMGKENVNVLNDSVHFQPKENIIYDLQQHLGSHTIQK